MVHGKTLASGAVAILAVVTIGGIALASADDPGRARILSAEPVSVPAAQPLNETVAARFSAFTTASPLVGDQLVLSSQSPLASVQRSIAALPARALARHADLARAIPVPIQGAAESAWIVPAGEGVCTIIPDPVDGAGIGCNTLTQVDKGTALTIMDSSAATNTRTIIVASPVPDEAKAPSLVTTSGLQKPLTVRSNLAVAAVPASGQVRSGQVSVELALFGAKKSQTATP